MAAFKTTSRAEQPAIVQRFLSTSGRFLFNRVSSATSSIEAGKDLHWLLRYARHGRIGRQHRLDPIKSRSFK